VKALGKYVLVIAGALLTGVAIFFLWFPLMDFAWTHIVVTDPQKISMADGVVVIAGWIVLGIVFGLSGAALVPWRYWPRRS